jgi:hypothetical protein
MHGTRIERETEIYVTNLGNKTKCRSTHSVVFSLQSKLYRPSDRRLSAKLVPILADRGCRVVSTTNPHGR